MLVPCVLPDCFVFLIAEKQLDVSKCSNRRGILIKTRLPLRVWGTVPFFVPRRRKYCDNPVVRAASDMVWNLRDGLYLCLMSLHLPFFKILS